MDKKTKLIIGGVVAAVAAYLLFFKKGSEDSSVVNARLGDSEPSEPITPACGGPNSIEGGPAKGKGVGNWVAIRKMTDRQFATDNLAVGMVVNIEGFCCTVSKLWMDSNDRVGAFQCEGMNNGEYNFPAGTIVTW